MMEISESESHVADLMEAAILDEMDLSCDLQKIKRSILYNIMLV